MAEKQEQVTEEMLQERVALSMLYDFYGALLKENQQQMFEAYILEDYSITEIAAEMGITRQGVHDAIKRTTKQLREYEQKLGLVKRFQEQREMIKQLHDRLREMNISDDDAKWKQIFDTLQKIL